MKTESSILETLKKLMVSKPLDEINVKMVCDSCGCHRQTFYYHYVDIYDALSAIYLSEEVEGFDKAYTPSEVLLAFITYFKKNLPFLKSTYDSSASDIIKEFTFAKIQSKTSIFLQKDDKYQLPMKICRAVSRRYANIVSSELFNCLKDPQISPTKLEKRMEKVLSMSESFILDKTVEFTLKEDQDDD
ncbi:MAG: hypothetical protein K5694_06350 [Bacilli bacterium]|nr:hypothetical protein [Bacilli bacterium]